MKSLLLKHSEELLKEWDEKTRGRKSEVKRWVADSFRNPNTWRRKHSEEEIELVLLGRTAILALYLKLVEEKGEKLASKSLKRSLSETKDESGNRIYPGNLMPSIQEFLNVQIKQINEENTMKDPVNNSNSVNTNTDKESTVKENKKESLLKKIQNRFMAEKAKCDEAVRHPLNTFAGVKDSWKDEEAFRSYLIDKLEAKAKKVASKASKEAVNSDKFKKLSDKEKDLTEKAQVLREAGKGGFAETAIRVAVNTESVAINGAIVSARIIIGGALLIPHFVVEGAKLVKKAAVSVFNFFKGLFSKDEKVTAPEVVPVVA